MAPRVACAIALSFPFLTIPLSASDAVDFAGRLIGRPYVWGAEGPGEFDCSGLTQYVYREVGIELPRRAISQSRVGDSARRLQRGDLLFFSTDTRRSLVTHVGIYEGAGKMIEASKSSGRVRRVSLDHDYFVERFMFARRITDGTGTVRPRGGIPPRREGRSARTARRVLEHIADVLLRRR